MKPKSLDYLASCFYGRGYLVGDICAWKTPGQISGARQKATARSDHLLIMGHTDVVGVQADNWYADPFSGMRQDGFIYGRGTLDDKKSVAAGLMVMKLLKRYGVELDRDVIFLAESGEEGTPEVGINYMVEKHFDRD